MPKRPLKQKIAKLLFEFKVKAVYRQFAKKVILVRLLKNAQMQGS
jgi:hypothetical protein